MCPPKPPRLYRHYSNNNQKIDFAYVSEHGASFGTNFFFSISGHFNRTFSRYFENNKINHISGTKNRKIVFAGFRIHNFRFFLLVNDMQTTPILTSQKEPF